MPKKSTASKLAILIITTDGEKARRMPLAEFCGCQGEAESAAAAALRPGKSFTFLGDEGKRYVVTRARDDSRSGGAAPAAKHVYTPPIGLAQVAANDVAGRLADDGTPEVARPAPKTADV
jgi:hypothetical protein